MKRINKFFISLTFLLLIQCLFTFVEARKPSFGYAIITIVGKPFLMNTIDFSFDCNNPEVATALGFNVGSNILHLNIINTGNEQHPNYVAISPYLPTTTTYSFTNLYVEGYYFDTSDNIGGRINSEIVEVTITYSML